jgi:hypothetical protein
VAFRARSRKRDARGEKPRVALVVTLAAAVATMAVLRPWQSRTEVPAPTRQTATATFPTAVVDAPTATTPAPRSERRARRARQLTTLTRIETPPFKESDPVAELGVRIESRALAAQPVEPRALAPERSHINGSLASTSLTVSDPAAAPQTAFASSVKRGTVLRTRDPSVTVVWFY